MADKKSFIIERFTIAKLVGVKKFSYFYKK